jgi:hypothetical protein
MPRLEGTRILFRHISGARSATGPVFAMASPTVTASLETQSLPESGEQPDVLPRHGREMRSTLTACLLIALVYVLSFSWISSALHQEYGFPLDDSWIHQTAGRNLALHGRPGIDPETRSSGTTSLLWTLVQAVNYKWLGPVDPVRYNEALSYLLLIFTGPLLFLLTRSDRTSIGFRWILAVSPAVMGNFLWLGMIGMEHLLFVVLSLAGICLWFQPGAGRRGNAFACGCISGLLALTRPEDACFGPFLVLLASSSTYLHRSLRDRLILLGVWTLFLAGWIAGEIRTSGSILPTTMKGRSWLYFHATGGPHSLHTILRFLGSWVQRLPRQFGTEFTRQLHYVGGIASPLALLGIALLALMLAGFIYLMRVGGSATRALLLWAWVQFCIYLVIFPAAGHGGRYQPLNLMLILPLLLTGFLALLRGMRLPDTAVVGAAGAALLVAGVLSLHTWRVVTLVGIRHINQTERQSAMWIRNHLAPGTEVGAFDIGRVSYEGSARIVDLGGLSDPAYMPYLTQGRVPEFLRLQGIRYVMLPSSGMEDLGFTPAYERHKLAEYCSPQEEWLLGFRYTIHAARCQEIYELPAQ